MLREMVNKLSKPQYVFRMSSLLCGRNSAVHTMTHCALGELDPLESLDEAQCQMAEVARLVLKCMSYTSRPSDHNTSNASICQLYDAPSSLWFPIKPDPLSHNLQSIGPM
uniref:AlNc14C19G1958 protein n=1 Tax=Albugo laibachii Nc14 TaxID=890382 RepID=F0W4Y7_9STRA|nr:AlNc14C19G1958 [Albugo laibachii Nc14]|eukprot:CCA16177.1 AlNc14C19G1958 [Albugo laibachii Nc14]